MRELLLLTLCGVFSLSGFAQTGNECKLLKVTDDGHSLESEDGTPFFWLGDTGWHLFRALTEEETIKYLDNRQHKGFNIIQCVIEASKPNRKGGLPFPDENPADFNEKYFAKIDRTIIDAAKRGIYIALLPTWGHSISPLWETGEHAIFNETNAYEYGVALGKRYAGYPNIVWVAGGDRPALNDTADWRPIYRNMVKGLMDGGAKQLVTYHPAGESSSTDFWKEEDLLDFHMLQSGHRKHDLPTWAWIRRDREYTPVKPVIDSEPNYEGHPVNWKAEMGYFNDYDVRKQLYRSVFAGAAGVTYGHHSVWQFHQKDKLTYAHPKNYWQEALDDPAAFQAGYLRRLMESRPAGNRIPAWEIVVDFPTEEDKFITSFYHEDKSYAMVYIPSGQTVNINTLYIGGEKIRAWWYNPKDNSSTKIGTFRKSKTMAFTPPSLGTGNDWVLVLDDASKKYGKPGEFIVDVAAQTKLPSLFGNKMMFQQNKPISIWGTAAVGKKITVDFYKGEKRIYREKSTTDKSAKWKITFPAQKGGYDKYHFEVKEGKNVVQRVEDILVGEVWLASGQSNMELPVKGAIDGSTLMANAHNGNIRFFLQPYNDTAPYIPNTDIRGAFWESGDNGKQVGVLSVIAYVMALQLQEQLNLPIGILNTAVGSSMIEAWLPTSAIEEDPFLVAEMKRLGMYFDEDSYPSGTNQMSSYYNLRIHPLKGYHIAGMIWYQGEGNKQRPQLYGRQLDLLKKSYGRVFGFPNNDMPLIFSHVCPWVESMDNPQYLVYLAEGMYDGWAMNPDDTAMLPLYDTDISYVGNVVIHPTNKTPVGRRFATAAMNLVYLQSGGYTAPVFDTLRMSGDTLYVKFSQVGDGLKTVNGIDDVRGFALCSNDGIYVGAKARIVSPDEVAVWNERLKNPQQVTYAWATFNVMSNLANSRDIPAAPFRSDRVIAGQKYYNPQDWTYADGDTWSVNADETAVGFLPAWSGATNAALRYDTTFKSEGKASLRVDYTVDGRGSTSVEPILTHQTVVLQLRNFNTISFDLLNPDHREKEILLLLKAVGGEIYKAMFIGQEGFTGKTTTAVVGKSSSFQTLTFLLKNLLRENNEPVTDPDEILENVEKIQFEVMDNANGTIYLDNVVFGIDI